MPAFTSYHLFRKNYGILLLTAAWLITLAFVMDNYWSASASLKQAKKKLETGIRERQQAVQPVLRDTALLRRMSSGFFSKDDQEKLNRVPAFLFFYEPNATLGEKLIAWNTHQVLPYPLLLYDQKKEGFVLLENGYYVWKRHEVNQFKIIELIPVSWDYALENEYLRNEFAFDKKLSARYAISEDSTLGLPVYNERGVRLFQVIEKKASMGGYQNPWSAFFRIMAFILCLIALHRLAKEASRRFGPGHGAVLLGIGILLLCVIMSRFHVPVNLRAYPLFSDSSFMGRGYAASLGHLAIQVLGFTWLMLFIRFEEWPFTATAGNEKIKKQRIMASAPALTGFTWFAGTLLKSLAEDPRISFDVLNFFSLNIFSLAGFLMLVCLCIGCFFFVQLMLEYIPLETKKDLSWLLLSIGICGLCLLSFRIGTIERGYEIYVLAWLLLMICLLYMPALKLKIRPIISSNLIFWIFFVSVSVTGVLIQLNRQKELNRRSTYAITLLDKADPSRETLMNTVLTAFNPAFLSQQFSKFLDPGYNAYLKDSLLQSNPAAYVNRFETRVFSFTADEKPLFNQDSTSFATINSIFLTQAKPTRTPDLFYLDVSYGAYSYLCRRMIRNDEGLLQGYIFIWASPQTVRQDALYPELFSKGLESDIEQSAEYSYALYAGKKMIRVHNDFPFPSQTPSWILKGADKQLVQSDGYEVIWMRSGGQRVVAIARNNNRLMEGITLFSYLFCSFLLMVALIRAGQFIWTALRNPRKLRDWKISSIRAQIHSTVLLISTFSFIVIGISTILFFIRRYESSNREKLGRISQVMEREFRNSLPDSVRIHKQPIQSLEPIVRRISGIHGTDLNVFSPEGDLKLSSIPLLYTRGIISTKMPPMAYQQVHRNHAIRYMQQEKIGKLAYFSNYVPIPDREGNTYAYLQIPSFAAESNLRKEISDFLVTIINLNAFIFLLAGIIALFVTNRITASLSLISDTMKKIRLGARNEPLIWNRQDELGILVKEYNRMLHQLDESARTLAMREREGAWQEMARQVAHEIKNPLTPMKLNLQFLQKAIAANAPDLEAQARRVSEVLVEQIDHLSRIAGDFSQFAQISEGRKEPVDMKAMVTTVSSLYADGERIRIKTDFPAQEVWVHADRTQINRLLSNLILNAIQAVPESQTPDIHVRLTVSDSRVKLDVSDNGNGIPPEIHEKIFMPNFTTKNSGTGLGLAMCHRIVEESGGSIQFDTRAGEGTVFTVWLPLFINA